MISQTSSTSSDSQESSEVKTKDNIYKDFLNEDMVLNQIQLMYSNENKDEHTSRFMQKVG